MTNQLKEHILILINIILKVFVSRTTSVLFISKYVTFRNIKPILRKEEDKVPDTKRELSPELAKISALVTGQPKQKSNSSKILSLRYYLFSMLEFFYFYLFFILFCVLIYI